jgi:hypothetical protein
MLVVLSIAAVYLNSTINRGNMESVGLIAGFLTVAGVLVLFLMYANLINYLAKAIGSLRAGSATSPDTGRFLG